MTLLQSLLPEFDPDIAREFGGGSTAIDFLGVPLFEATSLWTLLLRFVFNLLSCWVIIQFFYYRKSKRKDYYFTLMLFAVTIFLLISLMENMKLQIGFALGLFAIFGMIRYRTETIRIREMTYLFVIIGISIINGLAMTVSYTELVVTNLLFVLTIWALESNKTLKHTATKVILYDKIELVKHGKEVELKNDIMERTGLEVERVEVGHIDFLRDVAYVKVYYRPFEDEINTIDTMTKLRDFTD